jgi:hypothetical protein
LRLHTHERQRAHGIVKLIFTGSITRIKLVKNAVQGHIDWRTS